VIGEQVSQYTIVSALGRSGHGELFRGERVADKLAVTVQILPLGATSFAASGVHHPNLAKVIECGVTKTGHPYLVLPHFEGESLADRLESGPLTGPQVASVTHQIAIALDALHTAGFVHHCLTTAGVWIVSDGIVVLDAGLVMARGAYSAPEPWELATVVDPRADIYALGCVAFELGAGHPPFVGSPDEVLEGHRKLSPPVDDLAEDFPPTLEKLLVRMLDKDPNQRPRVARELARVLALLSDGETAAPLQATRHAPAQPSTVITSGPTVPPRAAPDAPTLVPRKR